MALAAGSHLGRYEILAQLGVGGMGEVYQARDTRLGRTVAIKILPPHLAGDERLRQRFEREARAVSSLNHPHICSLYDVGQQDGLDFIVLEYVEGETLAERLARGQLPIQQLMRDAAEIADALDKAHRRGVIHRDLKPANIMLTKSGPKLLDFGLARLREGAAPAEADRPSELSTKTRQEPLTVEGTILGTLPYMAPEQVEGKEADARSDIFALGAIVFEMATRRRAFEGATRAALTAAILERDPPPVSTLQPAASPGLDRVVGRCLAKDPEDRWQTACDLAFELRWIAEGDLHLASEAARTHRGRWRMRLGWIAGAGLLALAVAWLALGRLTPRTQAPRAVRLSLVPPTPGSEIGDLSVSPDGRTVAMVLWASGVAQLWVRPLDSLTGRALPGTEGARSPFWSPDGRFIGFFARGKLLKVSPGGEAPQVLCAAPVERGGSWSRQGTILFWSFPGGLQRLPTAGGEPTPVDRATPPDRQHDDLFPFFLPDGRHFLYLSRVKGGSRIMVGSLDSNQRATIMDGLSNAAYAPPGYLLFIRDGTLMSQPFDAKRLRLSGDAVPVAEHVAYADFGRFLFSVSAGGVLSYASESSNSRLVWYDRAGRELGQVGEPANYLHVDLSPDDTRLAIERGEPLGEEGEHDIWLMDAALGTSSRFTFDPDFEAYPVWSPDGSHIAFLAHRGGKFGLYWKPASGVGGEELLLSTANKVWPKSFTLDGRSLVFESAWEDALPDMWILSLVGKREVRAFERTPNWENGGMVSPDGRWIAYNVQDVIYVQSFPIPGGKWQVAAGAGYPRWRRDGKELFYGSYTGDLMAVEVRADTAFRTGTPRALFHVLPARLYKNRYPYAVTSDGQRFLINRLDTALSPVTIVLNWTAGLKR